MTLLVTPGDPAGIGPEVTAAALVATSQSAVVVGDPCFLDDARRAGLEVTQIDALEQHISGVSFLDPGSCEPVEVAAVRLAALACREDPTRYALVTGPIHKAKLAAEGFPFPGHTNFLGHLCGVERPVMAFVGGKLRVSLVTVHIPVSEVAEALTPELILEVASISSRALRDQLKISAPKLAICGLNPHAGDEGLIGKEELTVIGPACELAREAGLDVTDPVSAETAIRLTLSGEVDMMVAMYHDQGLAPLKAIDFGRSVNWTLGLPIVRTSVDHGTAYGIARRGLADPGSMISAMSLASLTL